MTIDETAPGTVAGQAQICGLAASHPPVEITAGQLMGAIGPATPGPCTSPAPAGGQTLASVAAGRSSVAADQQGASLDICGVAVALNSHADVSCGSAAARVSSAGVPDGASTAGIGLSPDGVAVTTSRTGMHGPGASASTNTNVARGTGDVSKAAAGRELLTTAGSGGEPAVSAALGAQLAGTGTPVLFVLAGLMMLSLGLALLGRSLVSRAPY